MGLIADPCKESSPKWFSRISGTFLGGSLLGRDLQNFWAGRANRHSELISQGRDLARLNGAFRLQVMENESLRQELQRMEALLDLPLLVHGTAMGSLESLIAR